MRKLFQTVSIFMSVLSAFSCGFNEDQDSPEGYVRHCVRLMDREALYADTPEWKIKKKEVLSSAKTIVSIDEAHALVEEAAKVAGGKHSFLAKPVSDTAAHKKGYSPKAELLEDRIVLVTLRAHTGVKISDSLYIHTVLDFLQDHMDVDGVIVNFGLDTGGNMGPMIAAVSPLLPDGVLFSFKSRKRTTSVQLESIYRAYGLSADRIRKYPSSLPVAILSGERTASAGELTLLCFIGLDNVKIFGSPSAGYVSGNAAFPLADGYRLAITRSCSVARTGEVFCENPIEPDVRTERPLEDAVEWIRSSIE